MDYFEKIVELVTSTDRSVVKAGISLLQSLDEVSYYDQLLEGIFPSAVSDGVLKKRCLSNKYFTLNPEKQRNLLDVLAAAPQTCGPAEDLRQAITRIDGLDYLPESLSRFGNVHTLKLEESNAITDLNAMEGLHSLEHVELRQCSVLTDVTALNTLPKLKTIKIWNCNRIETLKISGLPLQRIDVSSASSLRAISLTDCADLLSVDVSGSNNLIDLIVTGGAALSSFEAYSVPSLKNIQVDGNITSLKLRRADSLDSLDFVNAHVSPKSVELVTLPRVRTLQPLRVCTGLKHLQIEGFDELTDISALESLSKLEKIVISNCPKLQEVRSLSAITGPAQLHLRNLPIVDLSCLNQLRGFVSIHLDKTGNLIQLPSMENLVQLETLIIDEIDNLVEASSLQDLPGIKTLILRNLSEISDLTPVGTCSSLIHLTLSKCPSIQSIAPLSGLQNLQSLTVFDCDEIIDLRPLLELTKLEELDLGIDGDTVNYEILSEMSSLSTLRFERSWNTRLEKLKRMKITLPGCKIYSEGRNLVSPARSRPGTVVQFTSATEKRQFRKIRDLICSKSEENVITGVSLLKSLQNERIYQELLRDLSTADGHYSYGRYSGEPSFTNKYFSRSEASQHALFLTLSDAPVTFPEVQKVRDRITGISHTVLPEDLSGFPNVLSLRTEATGAKNLAAISGLTKIKKLRLSSCHELEDIATLMDLPDLESIGLHGCSNLTDLTPIAKLPNIKELSLSGFERLNDLSPLAELPDLTELSLSKFAQLTDLSPVAKIPNLKKLSLDSFAEVYDISPLTKIKNIENIKIKEIKKLKKINIRNNLTQLKNIKILYCGELKEITIEGSSTMLENIEITSCGNVQKLNVSDVKKLTKISFSDSSWYRGGSENVHILLKELPYLQEVSIKNKKIEEIFLQNLDGLTSLTLGKALSSCDLKEVGKLRNLETLTLNGWTNDYGFIANLAQLQRLCLYGNVSLSAFETMRGLTIQTLDIEDTDLSLADARQIKKILPDCKIITRSVTL